MMMHRSDREKREGHQNVERDARGLQIDELIALVPRRIGIRRRADGDEDAQHHFEHHDRYHEQQKQPEKVRMRIPWMPQMAQVRGEIKAERQQDHYEGNPGALLAERHGKTPKASNAPGE